MIHILLLILKIIGIVLLVILGLALLVLLFPITYIGNVEIKDNLVYCRLRAGWLFHIIHFGLKFKQSDVSYALRVFGITIVSSKKSKNKDSKENKDSNVTKEKKVDVSTRQATNEKMTLKNGKASKQEYKAKAKDAGKVKKSLIEKTKECFKNVKTKILEILKNIKEYKHKAKEIKSFLTANTTKEAYNYGKKIIVKLLKHILPKKIRGNVQFGFEEPHLTGRTLGYIAMGFSMFHINPKHIVIEPDFEKKVLVGNVKIKGRILAGVVAYYVLKLYFNKEINQIIKKFK